MRKSVLTFLILDVIVKVVMSTNAELKAAAASCKAFSSRVMDIKKRMRALRAELDDVFGDSEKALDPIVTGPDFSEMDDDVLDTETAAFKAIERAEKHLQGLSMMYRSMAAEFVEASQDVYTGGDF